MIHRTMLPLLVASCVAAACQSSTTAPQADAASEGASRAVSAAMHANARPHVPESAVAGSPILMPAIDEVRTRAHRDDMLALADDVAALGGARALALAANLRAAGLLRDPAQEDAGPAVEADETIRRWLDEAERMAPGDVTALVLSMDMLARDKARRSALIARWRRLEPDNLVPILHAELTEDVLFEAAATATTFDNHYDDALRTALDLLSRTSSPALVRLRATSKMQPEEHDATMAIAFWAASAMPAFHKVAAPCRAEGLSDVRLWQCHRIGETLMRHSDHLIAEMIGTAIIRRLSTATAAERMAAEAMDHEKDWLLYRTQELSQRDLRTYMMHFVAALRASPQTSERALMREVLRASGVPTTPPAGWRKDQDPVFQAMAR